VSASPPPIDRRRASDIRLQIEQLARAYAPGWNLEQDDVGEATVGAFAYLADAVTTRLNRAPRRAFAAFLDMLGVGLLPARPARTAVSFRTVEDWPAAIVVPAGTQLVAPPPDDAADEIPFETERPVRVLPGAIQGTFAVDPDLDAIYRPPIRFFDDDLDRFTPDAYRLDTFAASGSRQLQLSSTSGLEPGALLEVDGGSELFELATVSEVDDAVVALELPLERDHGIGAPSRRVDEFDLFRGVNLQQHILYVGHPDLFNISGAGEIRLQSRRAPGTRSDLRPLDVEWQYWGTSLTSDEPAWRPLQVARDESRGLSRSGAVHLSKLGGEISELEIRGTSSRWLRAVLREALEPCSTEVLPALDCIGIEVAKAAQAQDEPPQGSRPDFAAYETTPLDPNSAFEPFGNAPRRYDSFYVANEEALTKRGARVKIDIALAETSLSTPAMVASGGKARVFTSSSRAGLIEIAVPSESADPTWTRHGIPRVAGDRHEVDGVLGAPAAVVSGGTSFSVVRAGVREGTDAGESVYLYRSDNLTWAALGHPSGLGQLSDPSIVGTPGGDLKVLVVSSGSLYCKDVRLPSDPDWDVVAKPLDQIEAPPWVGNLGNSVMGVVNAGGAIYALRDLEVWAAPDVGRYADRTLVRERPQAALYTRNGVLQARIFALVDEGEQILCLDTDGAPALIAAPPSALTGLSVHVADPGKREEAIFMFGRGKDGQLYRRYAGSADTDDWEPLLSAGDPAAAAGPTTVALPLRVAGDADLKQGSSPGLITVAASDESSLLVHRTALWSTDVSPGVKQAIALHPDGEVHTGRMLLLRPGSPDEEYVLIDSSSRATGLARLLSDAQQDITAATPYAVFPPPEERVTAGSTEGHELQPAEPIQRGSIVELPNQALARVERGSDLVSGPVRVAPIAGVWPARIEAGMTYRLHDARREPELSNQLTSHRILLVHGGLPARAEQATGVWGWLESPSGPPSTATRVRVMGVDLAQGLILLGPGSVRVTVPRRLTGVPVDVGTANYANQLSGANPKLSWEYWNGAAWQALGGVDDDTRSLANSGAVEFDLPHDIAPTLIVGQEAHWIRARIIDGDYGSEVYIVTQTKDDDSDEIVQRIERSLEGIEPPLIVSMMLGYTLLEPADPEQCLTYNNLDYLDQTAACRTQHAWFRPFRALEDTRRSLYLGLERDFGGGAVDILFDARELPYRGSAPPGLQWTARGDRRWTPLDSSDETDGLTSRGVVALLDAPEVRIDSLFGTQSHWLRAELTEGAWITGPILDGIYFNSVWVLQARTIEGEVLGSSPGELRPRFEFARAPVLAGQEVRVLEPLSNDEIEELRERGGADAVVEPPDIAGSWVRWEERASFLESGPEGRHYALDRATGSITFGDGTRGRVPPTGVDNIRAFRYRSGGGSVGNVPRGGIESLASDIAGIEGATNAIAAAGGSDSGDLEDAFVLGPPSLAHRGRAVTCEDYEWLARELSRDVRRARCLPPDASIGGSANRLCIAVLVNSDDALPMPSREQRAELERSLNALAPLRVAAGGGVTVVGPDYEVVRVSVRVVVASSDQASDVRQRVAERLRSFMHPVSGGRDGAGWEFGRGLHVSDIYGCLRGIPGVLSYDDVSFTLAADSQPRDRVDVPPHALIAGDAPDVRLVQSASRGG